MQPWTQRLNERADKTWPCQRLRLGWSLVIFYVFELTMGQQLPEVMPWLALGLGLAMLGSAMYAIRSWKMKAQIALIMDALDHRAV